MEKLPNKVLENAIRIHNATIKAFENCKDADYCSSLDRATVQLLEELKEYRSLEEQGLLVKLPCKARDMIYYPWIYEGQSGVTLNEVESINIYYNRFPIITAKDWESDMCMAKTFTIEDFGKTVFLTREEAEQALKRLESES